MARLNSIDTIRGLSMWFMIYGHMLDWWIFPVDTWFRDLLYAFLEPICATGFLFVSGISATLSLRSSAINRDSANSKIIKYSYFFRAFFILLIGFVVNFFSILMLNGSIFDLWSWQVLQTIGFSLIFAWPFLKRSILFRIVLGLIFIIANQIILILLTRFSGQVNLFGVIFHFLFNPLSQYIILVYFGIFLIGTAIGEQIFIFNSPKSKSEKLYRFKSEFYKKYLLFGAILLGFGLSFAFPDFLYLNTISSVMFSLGIILVLMSLLISKDLVEKVKSVKSYRYLYFYSYYSFTIYLGHYAVYTLFLDQLNWIVFIFLVFGGFNAIITFLLRTMYVKVGNKLSLKTGINTLSSMLATKLVKRKQYKSIILLKDK